MNLNSNSQFNVDLEYPEEINPNKKIVNNNPDLDHTPAHDLLSKKFSKKRFSMVSIKKINKFFNKRNAIIISSIIGVITLMLFIFTLLIYFGVINIGSNQIIRENDFIQSSSSSQNSSNSQTNISVDQNRLNFPRFFTSQETISSQNSSSNLLSLNSSSVPITNYKIALQPQNFSDLKLIQSEYKECQNSTPVIGGNDIYTDQTGLKIEIGHSQTPVTEDSKRILELNKNFITGNAFLMADASSDWGPNFLNYFKENCIKTNVEKISDLKSNIVKQINFLDSFYVQIEIQNTNDFINYGYSLYGLKDGYIIKMSRFYPYDSGFSRAEKDNCLIDRTPSKKCLTDVIINSKLETINNNFLEDINKFKFNK